MDKKPIDWSLDELLMMAPSGGKNVEYAIGFYYENGVHTQADPVRAVTWYEKAAKKGHPEAQLRLGLMAAQGRGMEKDPKAAFGWLKKAADQGNANAQFNVGRCYE